MGFPKFTKCGDISPKRFAIVNSLFYYRSTTASRAEEFYRAFSTCPEQISWRELSTWRGETNPSSSRAWKISTGLNIYPIILVYIMPSLVQVGRWRHCGRLSAGETGVVRQQRGCPGGRGLRPGGHAGEGQGDH